MQSHLATREAIGTALNPVAPISGLIFFLVNKVEQFYEEDTASDRQGKARNPPITIPIVCKVPGKASAVMDLLHHR